MSDAHQCRPAHRLGAVALAASLAVSAALPFGAAAQTAPPPAPAAPAKGGVDFAGVGMGVFDKMMNKADATPDQRAKIKSILMGTVMSLPAQAPALKATASGFGGALVAPHVDRAGLESARVSLVAEFDAFSKVMVKAIGDAAEVLTPEQRAKIAAPSKPKS